MSDLQQLDKELREYLEKEPNLRRDDRLNYLKAIFNKHFEFTKLEHVINSHDLFDIISAAKSNHSKSRAPMFISRRKVDSSETPHVAMIEAVVSYFNKMSLMKKLAKFDYTE